jgi:Flp pilus assembly protein TadD
MHQHDRHIMSLDAARTIKLGVMGLICLMVILVAVGCNIRQFFGSDPSRQAEDKFWAGVRPASDDTDRLLRNFRYLKQVGRTQLALRELEQAHRQDPANFKIIDVLAQCYEEMGAWDQAEKLYLEALAHDQDNSALANNLCFSYYQAGKLDKAEACFRDLLKRQPANATVRNNLGLLLAKTGRQDEAYRLWKETASDTVARERLNQALAALGVAPRIDVARRPEPKAAAPALSSPGAASAPASARNVQPVSTPVMPSSLTSQTLGKQAAILSSTMTASAHEPVATPEKAAPDTKTPAPAKPAGPAPAAAPGTVLAASGAQPQAPAPVKTAAAPAAPAPEPVKPAPAAASGEAPAKQVKAAAPAAAMPAPKAVSAAVAASEPKRRGFLTAQELINTRLEILNGNGVKGIAALNRTWLTMEGFTVAAIGNHLDFGMQNTLIHYQPGAERVAKALQEDFFPQADLRPNGKPDKDADVKIVLGHDQKARKSQIAERIALLDLRAQLAVILAASEKNEVGQKLTAAAKPQAEASRQVSKAPPTTPAAPAASAPVAKPLTEALKLTPAELSQTRIELRNGNGVQDQARRLRADLDLQGFNVVRIKNHIDFGMDQTTILYRPGADKVAQVLGGKYFKTAKLAESAKLPENVDVKVILGKDLPGGLDLMAKLAD